MHEKNNKAGRAKPFLAGVALASVIGTYFLFLSKNSKKNREKVDKWVNDAKDDLMNKVQEMEDLTRDKYEDIVDRVTEKYYEAKTAGKEKVDKLKDDLKAQWENAEKEFLAKKKKGKDDMKKIKEGIAKKLETNDKE